MMTGIISLTVFLLSLLKNLIAGPPAEAGQDVANSGYDKDGADDVNSLLMPKLLFAQSRMQSCWLLTDATVRLPYDTSWKM